MRNLLLFSPRAISQSRRTGVFKLSRNYASAGVGYWDRPINESIKLDIESYWRDKVSALNGNRTNDLSKKYYVLSMFPYPSGLLHMGHVRVYTISDTIARFHRMNNKYVIHPIGWDAFGLPAENAAMERNVDPAEWTKQNIAQMREQLKALGCSFDWDREFATCEPSYYRWTQDLFLKLYDRELVYKKKAYVNWDPVDKTVLAEEQVSEDGTSWRSGAKVEKKLLSQWFIRTTAFSESLRKGLENPALKQWDDIIKIQRNWLGVCDGSSFTFNLISDNPSHPDSMELWTRFPEFIHDAKFVAASRDSVFNTTKVSQDEKLPTTLVPETHFVNPFTGAEIPVYLTDDVEFPTGKNVHLGIPTSSENDAEFCRQVGLAFDPPGVTTEEECARKRREVMKEARERHLGGYPVSSHLGDWLISRQRFWGTPIPIVHCEKCGDRPVPREQLPVELPKAEKGMKLENLDKWRRTECPGCGGPALRETDTMDTFVDSSWYFMRYLDPRNENEMVAKEKVEKLMPVDLYIGGKEHALLHLYYARFMSHFLHSEGLLPFREPFMQLLVMGFVMGKTYRVKQTGKYIRSTDVEKKDGKFVEISSGLPVSSYWDKMSKSKNNGADPNELFDKHSTDTIRLLIMSDAAPESQRNWTTDSFDIITNWENRLWLLMRQFLKLRKSFANGELEIIEKDVEKDEIEMFQHRNYHLTSVNHNLLDSQQLSVAISKMQSFTKRLRGASPSGMVKSRQFERSLATLLTMIAPLAPHFASELWAGFCLAPGRIINDGEIQWDKEVLEQNWPEIDMDFKLSLAVAINTRPPVRIAVKRRELVNATIEDLIKIAETNEKVKYQLSNWEIVNAESCSPSNTTVYLNLTTKRKSDQVAQETTG